MKPQHDLSLELKPGSTKLSTGCRDISDLYMREHDEPGVDMLDSDADWMLLEMKTYTNNALDKGVASFNETYKDSPCEDINTGLDNITRSLRD